MSISHRMLVYSASAGSGKTFTLAARYIALLMEGESFDRILAVTFTQKATAEMKQRIMAYLYAIGTGTMKEDDAFLHTVEEYMEGELPKDFRYRFLVRPCECFGKKGEPIYTDWIDGSVS